MRIFGGQRISGMMDRLGLPADTPIEHGMITSSIERAQKKVEQYHFSIRKQVLQYDDVVNRQRETIYTLRHKLLVDSDVTEKINEFLVKTNSEDKYREKAAQIPPDMLRNIERLVLLREIDRKWIDHLHNLDVLREGIGLRAYGQLDPLTEYKIEGFKLFQTMLDQIADDTVETLLRVQVVHELPQNIAAENYRNMQYSGGELTGGIQSPMQGQARPQSELPKQEPIRATEKVGRNDACPCGSGKKYKNCCMKE